jgi:hypothetical protein
MLALGLAPVLTIIGTPTAVAALGGLAGIDGEALAFPVGVAFGAAFVAGWAVWSWRAPAWRLWALANVTDADAETILQRAKRGGLLWRPGHFLERTEFRGSTYSYRLAAAELAGIVQRSGVVSSVGLEVGYWQGLLPRLEAAVAGVGLDRLARDIGAAAEHVEDLGGGEARARELIAALVAPASVA